MVALEVTIDILKLYFSPVAESLVAKTQGYSWFQYSRVLE
jgi:hypothetical protein